MFSRRLKCLFCGRSVLVGLVTPALTDDHIQRYFSQCTKIRSCSVSCGRLQHILQDLVCQRVAEVEDRLGPTNTTSGAWK